jgi:glycosyltransferase involved in cell wall biosynthesis
MISVIIPAHNESNNLKELVPKIHSVLKKQRLKHEIIVVNDNSTDNSSEILSNLDVICIDRHDNKPGVGRNYRAALKIAKGGIIVFMDGDFSHNPEEIPLLLNPIFHGVDFVQGSRYMKSHDGTIGMKIGRKFMSKLFNLLIRIMLGIQMSDYTSGFRAIRKNVLDKIELESNYFDVYVEIPIKLCLIGARVEEVPFNYNPRLYGKSNLNYLKMGPKYLRVIFRQWIKQKILRKKI